MSHLISVVCPCGKTFEAPQWRVNRGRGKRCSKECQYRYATRPSGLTYNITKENPTAFKAGQAAWNSGLALKDRVTYKELHRWVARHKVKTGSCQRCEAAGYTEWANLSHEYRRDLDDWLEMCRTCHRQHDLEARGAATAIFGEKDVQCR